MPLPGTPEQNRPHSNLAEICKVDRTLRIDELPDWMTPYILGELCQTLGTVASVRLFRDFYRHPMRYGLVEMTTNTDAENVVAALNRHRTFGIACLVGTRPTRRHHLRLV